MNQGGLNLGDGISWVIVFVGWLVINRQHNARETRKEIRASLTDLYKLLDGIESDAFNYHTGDADVALARKIKRELDQIFARVRLAVAGTVECECSKEISAFRKAITLKNFDTTKFERKSSSDQMFDEIMLTKRQIITALETAYNRRYR